MARLFSRNDPDRVRQQMVDGQLAARDIDDPRVLAAMATVPRVLETLNSFCMAGSRLIGFSVPAPVS